MAADAGGGGRHRDARARWRALPRREALEAVMLGHIGSVARGAVEAAKDAVPAAGAVGAASVGGAAMGAPAWLLGLAQAVIVVYFTLRGVDRRQRERDQQLAALDGEVQAILGRMRLIRCLDPGAAPALTPCPSSRLITLGSE